jgi:hypothetical protein
MPTTRQVSAKSPKLGRETVAIVTTGETAEESVQMFGSEAVNSNANAHWIVTIQAFIRRCHEAGKSDEEIQDLVAKAKMGVTNVGGGVDPIQAALAKFKTLDPDAQAKFIKELKASAGK